MWYNVCLEEIFTSPLAIKAIHSPGSSASSRDCSPIRDSPFGSNLKPPVVIRKGPRGYGFTLRAIRVFHGDTNYFTLHHMIVVSSNHLN